MRISPVFYIVLLVMAILVLVGLYTVLELHEGAYLMAGLLFLAFVVRFLETTRRATMGRTSLLNIVFRKVAYNLHVRAATQLSGNVLMSGNLGRVKLRAAPERKRATVRLSYPGPDQHQFSVVTAFHAKSRVSSGDEAFDALLALTPDQSGFLWALLDAETRNHLVKAAQQGCHFDIGPTLIRIRYRVEENTPEVVVAFSNSIRDLAAVGNRITAIRNIFQNLKQNALGDRIPAVRVRCLQEIQRLFAERQDVETILGKAMEDPAPIVRVEAAHLLGGETGTALLHTMFTHLEEWDGPVQTRLIMIMCGLEQPVPTSHTYQPDTNAEYLALLQEKYPHLNTEEAKLAALAAVTLSRASNWSDLLVNQLDGANEALMPALLDALAVCGDSHAAQAISERTWKSGNAALAEKALVAIQARLGEESVGRLSIAELGDTDGALSKAEQQADEGALSSN